MNSCEMGWWFALDGRSSHGGASLGQCPWLWADNLSLTICPKVGNHANDVVQAGVGALVDQESAQCAEWIHDQAGLDGSVQTSAGEKRQRPLPGKTDDTKQEVEDLQDGHGLDGGIEVLCEEVPEDLWPEKGFYRSADLISSSCEDDQARPVVLD